MLDVEAPIVVVGDIHGQFRDLQMIFQQQGAPDKGTYVFHSLFFMLSFFTL